MIPEISELIAEMNKELKEDTEISFSFTSIGLAVKIRTLPKSIAEKQYAYNYVVTNMEMVMNDHIDMQMKLYCQKFCRSVQNAKEKNYDV